MNKEQKVKYDGDYSFLQNLAMESARKGKVDRAEKIILYMMEKWPERVIRHKDSVLAKDVIPPTEQSSNP